jgi:hypothetical protein
VNEWADFLERNAPIELAGLLAVLSHWQFFDSMSEYGDNPKYTLNQAVMDYAGLCGTQRSTFSGCRSLGEISDKEAFQGMAIIANYLAGLF